MKEIQLTRGLVAQVDDRDFAQLNQHKWYANKKGNVFYAMRNIGKWPFQKTIFMHREITNAPQGFFVDHIDGNGLNNQRGNLRVCTNSENQLNRHVNAFNATGYKGVKRIKSNKFQARITINGERIYLGTFTTAEEAAQAYNKAVQKHW